MERYNLIVIGGGSGGLTVAAIAAILGARVALLEKGQMGGDCLNDGCVPSKALLRGGIQLKGEGPWLSLTPME
jgi:pyruvate/2-oxoglutarate dehydrogenase complex dihydrolipoamide dehydrogenase (E3) component